MRRPVTALAQRVAWCSSGALDESAVCDGAELDQQSAPLPGKQQKKPPCERPPSTLPFAESTKARISAPGEERRRMRGSSMVATR